MVSTSVPLLSAMIPPATIAGGFVPVPVRQLIHAWRVCRTGPLGVADFRTWLACHEMRARRGFLEPDRAPCYNIPELAWLLGVSLRRARASVLRLVEANLIEWSESALEFPDAPVDNPNDLGDTIGGGMGRLAIPRRLLRVLVGGARPALIATALAILLRCLSQRRDGFDGRGRVKASWIARVFGIDLRRVKAARQELIALGWIEPEPSDQHSMNRWGRVYRINLDWARPGPPECTRLPPPPAGGGSQLPPPLLNQDPFQEEFKHQEPAWRPETGVELKTGEEEKPTPPTQPAPTATIPTPPAPTLTPTVAPKPAAALPAPNLDDVRVEDLRDTGRTLRLFDQAVARKLIGSSEADRLKFVAAAEHARVVGTVNPGGLFARLVRRGWWHFATLDDEESASKRLRTHLYGRPPEPVLARPVGRVSTFVPEQPPASPSPLGNLLGRLMQGGRS